MEKLSAPHLQKVVNIQVMFCALIATDHWSKWSM